MMNTKTNLNTFKRILGGSIQYEIDHGELTITSYYTGERVTIDLMQLTEDMFEDLLVTDDDDDDDDDWEEE